MGVFGKIWSGVKKAAGVAGVAGKLLLKNDSVRQHLAKGFWALLPL